MAHHASRRRPRTRFALTLGGAALGLTALGCGIFVAWAAVVSIPSLDNFESRRVAESTKIFDRTGKVLLFDVHGAMRRTAVPLEDISPHIRNATVAIEDTEFYRHNGFRPRAFLRAILVNLGLREGYAGQGGSTITQQVVKNTLLTRDKTIVRKLKEIVLALKLERVASKEQILEIYLNETSYGGTIYGVEEAAQYFYGKSAGDVTAAEAAYLSALPQAPTRLSPYGQRRNELDGRKNLVLSRMYENGYLPHTEYEVATRELVQFRDVAEAGIKAPHFVFFVREYLEEKYGADAVSNGGLRVITTLDYELQKKGEEIVREYALQNEKNFNAENAGLAAIDPRSGHLLAMVGSRGYFDENIDGKVNVVLTHRQPGSSFKPFVYARAFEEGYTPETILFDVPTQFSSYCPPDDLTTHDRCYAPVNYDGKFRGPMTLRDALAQSINVVAVKVLYLVGIQDALALSERLGITTLKDRDRYGLTLVLGGGEVSLLEMVGAYSVFANDGLRNSPTAILEVKDGAGTVLEGYERREERVLDPEIARTVSDVLSDNVARTPGFGSDSALHFPGRSVAAKTGTTNDYRDAWIIGYTPALAVGAWAGNNDNTPMEKRVAGFIVAPLWREFMERAFESYPTPHFAARAPIADYESLPPTLRGIWNAPSPEGVHEILHWIHKDNPRLAAPPSLSDPQYPRWEYSVTRWANGGVLVGTTSSSLPPSAPTATDFAIASPSRGQVSPAGAPIRAGVEYLSSFPVSKVTLYLDGEVVGSSATSPFEIEFVPPRVGVQTIRAVAEGPLGVREDAVTITVE